MLQCMGSQRVRHVLATEQQLQNIFGENNLMGSALITSPAKSFNVSLPYFQ